MIDNQASKIKGGIFATEDGTEWRMSSRTQDCLCFGAVAGWREDILNRSATALGQPCHWEMLPALILESSRDWLPAPGALSCS